MSPEVEQEGASPEDLYRVIDQCLDLLAEHFETVQIFASGHNSRTNVTDRYSSGVGNWYARYGQVKLWCKMSELDEPETDEE